MLGKIVGKEDKVKAWKKDWEETTAKDGKEIKKAIGQDATVSLFDEFDKNYTLTAITGVVVEKYYIKHLV